jgi:tetratricopeptide (TPR) repeat protein
MFYFTRSPCEKKILIECCANCEITNCQLLKCGRCALVKYCSKECQKQHWKSNHKTNCISLEERQPKIQEKVKEQDSYEICCICMESIESKDKNNYRHLVCDHIFHSECIFKWLEEKQCCPLCNTIFTENNKLAVEFIKFMRKKDTIEIDSLIKKLKLCKQSNNTLYMLSEIYIYKGQIDKAEQILKVCIKKLPSDIFTEFNLAKLYKRTEQRYLARKHYEKCINLLSEQGETKEFEQAILISYSEFLINNPEISQNYLKLLKIKKNIKEYFQFIKSAEEYITITKEDRDCAIKSLRRVLEINPECYKAYILLARIIPNIEERLNLYTIAIKYDDYDKSSYAYYGIATTLLKLDRYEEATEYYTTAVKLNKTLACERLFYLAEIMLNKKNIKEGLKIFTEIAADYRSAKDF